MLVADPDISIAVSFLSLLSSLSYFSVSSSEDQCFTNFLSISVNSYMEVPIILAYAPPYFSSCYPPRLSSSAKQRTTVITHVSSLATDKFVPNT